MKLNDPLAQSGSEQRTFNPKCVGSNPTWITVGYARVTFREETEPESTVFKNMCASMCYSVQDGQES
jgi:hypothetical protein